MALAFLAVTAPWLARNYVVSHSVLGLAQYSIIERTPAMRLRSRTGISQLVAPISAARTCGSMVQP